MKTIVKVDFKDFDPQSFESEFTVKSDVFQGGIKLYPNGTVKIEGECRPIDFKAMIEAIETSFFEFCDKDPNSDVKSFDFELEI